MVKTKNFYHPITGIAMQKTLAGAVIIASVIAAVHLHGQNTQFTLSDAISIALQNNHDIRVAKLEVRKADEDVREAFGNALPKLDLSADYTRNVERPVFFLPFGENGENLAVPVGSKNSVTSNLDLEQVIFNSAVFTGVGTAKVFADAAREQLKSNISEIELAVKQAYYVAMLARERLEVEQAGLENAQSNFNDVKTLYGEGLVSEFDMIRAEVQVENIRPRTMSADNDYTDALNDLKVVLGMETGNVIQLADRFDFAVADEQLPGVVELQDQAIANNYGYRALKLQETFNEELIAVQRSEFLPTLSFFGNMNFQGQSDDFSFSFERSASVGLRFRLSLFNGFQSTARLEKSHFEFRQSRQRVLQMRETIQAQVIATVSRLETAKDRIAAQKRTVEQAQRGYDIARTRYREGIGDQIEISDSDLSLRQAKLNRIQALYDYVLARAGLDNLLGVIRPDAAQIDEDE